MPCNSKQGINEITKDYRTNTMKRNSLQLLTAIHNRELIANDTSESLTVRNKANRQANHFEKSLDAIIADYPTNVITLSKTMASHKVRVMPCKVKRNLWKCLNSNCRNFDVIKKDKEVYKDRQANHIISLCLVCSSKLQKASNTEGERFQVTLPKYHCGYCAKFIKGLAQRKAITRKIENGMIAFCPTCGNGITEKRGFRRVKDTV